MPLRFDVFIVDDAARCLARDGKAVQLSPKAFDLLTLLLRGRPAVQTRAQIQDRLWPRTCVGPTSVPRVISEIRQALGDSPTRPRFIRTVIGHGYAFCGEAAGAGSSSSAVPCGPTLLWHGREIDLQEGENLIGRGDGCVVRSRSRRVSRYHACVRVSGQGATLEDLGSRNGTFLDGRRVACATPLVNGGVIAVGEELLVFLGPPETGSTETERPDEPRPRRP